MRLSEDKRTELYDAIIEPIIQKRIEVKRNSAPVVLTQETVDQTLYELQDQIWKEVCNVLNI